MLLVPYLLLDQYGVPIPGKTYDCPLDAMAASRAYHQRCIVVLQEPDGRYTPLAYSGPGGWSGPGVKAQPKPYAFSLPKLLRPNTKETPV